MGFLFSIFREDDGYEIGWLTGIAFVLCLLLLPVAYAAALRVLLTFVENNQYFLRSGFYLLAIPATALIAAAMPYIRYRPDNTFIAACICGVIIYACNMVFSGWLAGATNVWAIILLAIALFGYALLSIAFLLIPCLDLFAGICALPSVINSRQYINLSYLCSFTASVGLGMTGDAVINRLLNTGAPFDVLNFVSSKLGISLPEAYRSIDGSHCLLDHIGAVPELIIGVVLAAVSCYGLFKLSIKPIRFKRSKKEENCGA